MLQNAYFLAKIGADTAENEQHFAEILPETGNYPTGPRHQDSRVRNASVAHQPVGMLPELTAFVVKNNRMSHGIP